VTNLTIAQQPYTNACTLHAIQPFDGVPIATQILLLD